MKLVVRADASPSIGFGHVMRCAALGQAWQDKGGEVTFACSNLLESVASLIQKQRFALRSVDANPGSPEDARQLLAIAHAEGADAVVLDGYAFDVSYQELVSTFDGATLSLDDQGLLSKYPTDLVLNQNLGAHALPYASRESAGEFLLGADYTLLRRELRSARTDQCSIQGRSTNVLVTMGAADPNDCLNVVTEGLKRLDEAHLRIRVASGALNRNHDHLVNRLSKDARFQIVRHVEDMVEAYRWADLAVSAGGSSTWEMCFFGVPIMMLVVAENQRAAVRALAETGAGVSLGWWEDATAGSVHDCCQSLLRDPGKMAQMAAVGRVLIDGQGAGRVCDRLIELVHQRKR